MLPWLPKMIYCCNCWHNRSAASLHFYLSFILKLPQLTGCSAENELHCAVFNITCYICAFRSYTSDFSQRALSYTTAGDGQRVANYCIQIWPRQKLLQDHNFFCTSSGDYNIAKVTISQLNSPTSLQKDLVIYLRLSWGKVNLQNVVM